MMSKKDEKRSKGLKERNNLIGKRGRKKKQQQRRKKKLN